MMRAGSIRRSVALLLLIVQSAGCYQYVPVGTPSVHEGSNVSIAFSDRGRVMMEEAIGPGVRRVTGDVLTSNDTTITVAVTTVDYLDVNVPVKWSGESVVLMRSLITEVREKRLSRSRTFAFAGLIVAGAIAASALVINGFGIDSGDNKPPDGGGQQFRTVTN